MATFRLSDYLRDNPRDSVPRRARRTDGYEVMTGWVVQTYNPVPGTTRHIFVEGLGPEMRIWVSEPGQIEFT